VIDHVGRMLEKLVHDRVDGTIAVSFDPPDKDWRTQRRPADRASLSIYLVDLRENRTLRSTERHRTVVDGRLSDEPAPRRIDCHYVVSAWSHTKPGPATSPTLDEHAILHRFSTAVANAQPFGAAAVYADSPLPPDFPAELVDIDLPVALLPTDGYPKLAELWGTMGDDQPLKPVVYITVTVPLVLDAHSVAPIVRTTELRFRSFTVSGTGTDDRRFGIGGSVLDTTAPLPDGAPAPVADVWVDLLNEAGVRRMVDRTDAAGRFDFAGLPAGQYHLRAAVTGFEPLAVPVTVPANSADDRYDLLFG
jgi:hypothetical protein